MIPMDKLPNIRNTPLTRYALALFLLLVLACTPSIYGLDDLAEAANKVSLMQAGSAFAVVRTFNAVISVLHDTSIGLSFGGSAEIGIGKALDPLDNMIERVSDLLVVSISAYGVYGILHELGQALLFKLAASFVGLGLMCHVLRKKYSATWLHQVEQRAVRLGVILVLIRLIIPLTLISGAMLDTHFFAERIDEKQAKIEALSLHYEQELLGSKKDQSLSESIKGKYLELKKAFSHLTENLGEIINHLTDLIILYLGFFVVQIFLMPYLGYCLIKACLRSWQPPSLANQNTLSG